MGASTPIPDSGATGGLTTGVARCTLSPRRDMYAAGRAPSRSSVTGIGLLSGTDRAATLRSDAMREPSSPSSAGCARTVAHLGMEVAMTFSRQVGSRPLAPESSARTHRRTGTSVASQPLDAASLGHREHDSSFADLVVGTARASRCSAAGAIADDRREGPGSRGHRADRPAARRSCRTASGRAVAQRQPRRAARGCERPTPPGATERCSGSSEGSVEVLTAAWPRSSIQACRPDGRSRLAGRGIAGEITQPMRRGPAPTMGTASAPSPSEPRSARRTTHDRPRATRGHARTPGGAASGRVARSGRRTAGASRPARAAIDRRRRGGPG